MPEHNVILPASLEIGAMTYRLRADSQTVSELAREDLSGQCRFRDNTIALTPMPLAIRGDAAPDRFRKTVLHELLHAIDNEYQRDDCLTEAQTDRLSQGLAQVLKQLGVQFRVEPPDA